MTHEVKLGEVFEGPIDLLLHLITRQRVDIYEVSLATITDDYIRTLESMGDLDLEVATGFLVVAATLLELKSARLLPGRSAEGEDALLLEERDRLLAKLVEVATFRSAGEHIRIELGRGEVFFPRDVGLEEPYLSLAPDPLQKVTLELLAGAAAEALAPRPEPELDVSHVAPLRESVRDALVEVAERLRAERVVGFQELCGGRSRLEVVVRFLALLELYKAGAIDLYQGERFADIRASWADEVDLEEVLVDVDEYSVPGGEQ
jgi:segregation and condensation protein A